MTTTSLEHSSTTNNDAKTDNHTTALTFANAHDLDFSTIPLA